MTPRGGTTFTLAVVAAAALVVGAVRSRAEAARSAAKETTEAFLLPPAAELRRVSLGYRSALADYLWAHVLVTQGLRLGERRRFATVTSYLDTITSLDPDFREPFRLADTLTTMQAKSATIDDIRAARRLLEKGVAAFPDDAELWLSLGQFVVYVAPASYLTDPEEQLRWRLEGAAYLARAAELGSQDAGLAWRAMGGARQLFKSGQIDATVRFYKRALAVTEDAELRADIETKLGALLGEQAAAAERARRSRFEHAWKSTYPTWSISGVFIAPPPFNPALCAGGTASVAWNTIDCTTTWGAWYRVVDAELQDQALAAAATTPPASEPARLNPPAPPSPPPH